MRAMASVFNARALNVFATRAPAASTVFSSPRARPDAGLRHIKIKTPAIRAATSVTTTTTTTTATRRASRVVAASSTSGREQIPNTYEDHREAWEGKATRGHEHLHHHHPPPTSQLLSTQTNDIVDAIIARALRLTPSEANNEKTDKAEPGKHVPRAPLDSLACDANCRNEDLVDALVARADDLTGSEAADCLWVCARSPEFRDLPNNACGRLLDAVVKSDFDKGPLRALHKLYLDTRTPMSWMRPQDEERRRYKKAAAKAASAVAAAAAAITGTDPGATAAAVTAANADASPWTGDRSTPHYSWHMPYDFSVADVTHIAYALVALPRPLDQRAANDRALTAKSLAYLTAQFSKVRGFFFVFFLNRFTLIFPEKIVKASARGQNL